jgi:hypothetical protein
MVAVARVEIAGEVRVYIGIKVPTGTMSTSAEAFPADAIADYVRQNLMRPGKRLARLIATEMHAVRSS